MRHKDINLIVIGIRWGIGGSDRKGMTSINISLVPFPGLMPRTSLSDCAGDGTPLARKHMSKEQQ